MNGRRRLLSTGLALAAMALPLGAGGGVARAGQATTQAPAAPAGDTVGNSATLAEAERLILEGQAMMDQGFITNDRLLKRGGMRLIRDGMKIKRALAATATDPPAAGEVRQ